MNEPAGTTGSPGTDDPAGTAAGTPMGAAEAADIMADAARRARRQFRVSHRVTFTVWGLGLLLGYGSMWLTVRGQRPPHGRADSGVGGLSAIRRRASFLSVLIGLAAMFALGGALAHTAASQAAISVFEASAPVLVAGLFYLSTSIVQLNWPVAGLGAWLLAVAAAGGFAGPAGVWGVNALAAGLAYLLMAVIEPRLRWA